MDSLFKYIPEKFFSPLASLNKEHHAQALLIFYEQFLASPSGIDRDGYIDRLEKYCESVPVIELEDVSEQMTEDVSISSGARSTAFLLFRKIKAAGWVTEETLPDYTRVLNLPSYAKPFFDALYQSASGGSVEYESHIVAIYSLICGGAILENGHLVVMRAHEHITKLLDSLKLLSQNIRTHYENMFSNDTEIPDILNAHYNVYMDEIIDRAYNRLKTSDNLSRYRPEIISQINTLLDDEEWLSVNESRLTAITSNRAGAAAGSAGKLRSMLEDVRDNLRHMDTVIDDIDRRNRMYSRISTEKIRNRLYSDSSISGKLIAVVRALQEDEIATEDCEHGVFRLRSLSSESCSNRFRTEKESVFSERTVPADTARLDAIEEKMLRRIALQLNVHKISDYLDTKCSESGITEASSMIESVDDYIRVIYAGIYASPVKTKFGFGAEWDNNQIFNRDGNFELPSHRFYRKKAEKMND